MHPGQMSRRCPDALASRAFILQDWQLKFYSHATIEPKPGSQTAGVLWTITPECEQSLDRFEGWPSYYTKRVWTQAGIEFFFYEMTDPKSGHPSAGYVQDIQDSYEFWRLPMALLQDSLHDFA